MRSVRCGRKRPRRIGDHFRNSQIEQPFAAPGDAETAPSSPADWNPGISCRDNQIIDRYESDPEPRRNCAGHGFIRAEDRSPKSVGTIIDSADRFLIIFHSEHGNHRRKNIVVKESAIW